MHMGPQSSVSMTAQQMLAQVRSPPQPGNVRSPGPRMQMGMPSPRMQQQSPRHPQPMDDMGSSQMMLGQSQGPQGVGQGPPVGGPPGQGNGDNGDPGMTPQDQLSKYVETL